MHHRLSIPYAVQPTLALAIPIIFRLIGRHVVKVVENY